MAIWFGPKPTDMRRVLSKIRTSYGLGSMSEALRMKLVREIAAGVAASGLFAIIEAYLVPLAPPWKIVGFVATFAVAFLVAARATPADKGDKVMSGVSTDEDMTAAIRRSDIAASQGSKIMSDNNVKGSADFTIEDTTIRSK